MWGLTYTGDQSLWLSAEDGCLEPRRLNVQAVPSKHCACILLFDSTYLRSAPYIVFSSHAVDGFSVGLTLTSTSGENPFDPTAQIAFPFSE